MAAKMDVIEKDEAQAWRGFRPGHWQSRINVRDFIQRNYTPYEGDAGFLAEATERTRKVWEKLLLMPSRSGRRERSPPRRSPRRSSPMRRATSTRIC